MILIKRSLINDIDLLLCRKITFNQAKEKSILPIYEKDNVVYAASTPNNYDGRNFLEVVLGKDIKLLYISLEEITELIDVTLRTSNELEEDIFKEAVKMNVSDIHFEPSRGKVNIRYRINGSLILKRKIMLEEYLKIISRLKVRANMDITERRKAQDGKLIMNDEEGKKYNCRIASMPLIEGEKLVLRIIYDEGYKKIINFNFTDKQKESIRKIKKSKNGLVIINGPTGSGKTTTLYSMLEEIKDDYINITTIEDPVEITMDEINQINVNEKSGITFASGLRGILRQDPDVIMIGEIRDGETAKAAVRAAITGHKVFSTIHTKSPREVYLRLEEMGVKGYLIRSALVGVISQRLIGILCDECKELIGEKVINSKKIKIYKKHGCERCNRTGIKTRNLISAIYYIDKNLREDIKDIYEKENLLSNDEMIEGLNNLLIKGQIDYYDFLGFIEGEEINETGL